MKQDYVVLGIGNASPHSHCHLGKVTKTYPNEHGITCQVLVKTCGHEVKRPIHKLCLVLPENVPVVPSEISDHTTDFGK